MVKIENVSIGPQSIKAQMVQKDKVFTDKMCGQDTSTFKKKRETDKEKKKNNSLASFPSFPTHAISMEISSSEIKSNTGLDFNDGVKIFNDEGSKSDLDKNSVRWLETR